MSLIKLIPKKSVLNTAMNLIKKSKKSLIMTMIMNDELNSISSNYINLLKYKITEGIMIKRIGFGTKNQYQKALQQLLYSELPKNFIFVFYPNMSIAQRLLISDNKAMLFAVYIGIHSKMVFYSKNKFVIKGFIEYFKNVYKKALELKRKQSTYCVLSK